MQNVVRDFREGIRLKQGNPAVTRPWWVAVPECEASTRKRTDAVMSLRIQPYWVDVQVLEHFNTSSVNQNKPQCSTHRLQCTKTSRIRNNASDTPTFACVSRVFRPHSPTLLCMSEKGTAHSDADELTRGGWRARRDVGSAEAPVGGCSCMLHPHTSCLGGGSRVGGCVCVSDSA